MRQLMLRFLVLLVILIAVPVVLSESSHGDDAHRPWRQLMESRRPHLKKINPLEHFHHILGDVHVFMWSGEKYKTDFRGLDVFGYPLIYKSHLDPRFHIFNSDFDPKIQDVYIDGNRVLEE